MLQERASGILLHPTSLPGGDGIGDLGDPAFAFVDSLHQARLNRWQVLPLGPTGYGDSPYASFSSFAGNPLLISLDLLADEFGLERKPCPIEQSTDSVSYGDVIAWKIPALRSAAQWFLDYGPASGTSLFDAFCEEQTHWLDDYALFMSVKEVFGSRARDTGVDGAMWNNFWEADIALREPKAVATWTRDLAQEIDVQKALQYFFFSQWRQLKQYANDRGILIIGDVPIFVAMDSADVWSSPESFMLDESGQPQLVAGVPPDYFSETGQRWGNPVYNWDVMRRDDFSWWVNRIKGTLNLVDIVRVDHFRGFDACWSIPASEPTAVNGSWVKAPGRELFSAIRRQLGDIPILAEDLGVITAEVDRLRDEFGFPGMRILQFAFDDKEERSKVFLPHNYHHNCAVYTGTHDNDSIAGWLSACSSSERAAVENYVGPIDGDIVWKFIRMALGSVANLAIIPIQDVLELGSESRMNTPGTQGANWTWRMSADNADGKWVQRLAQLVDIYQRSTN